jgi:hypothetical protein
MPIAALTLYVFLYSVRQRAPENQGDSQSPEASAQAPDSSPDP